MSEGYTDEMVLLVHKAWRLHCNKAALPAKVVIGSGQRREKPRLLQQPTADSDEATTEDSENEEGCIASFDTQLLVAELTRPQSLCVGSLF